ncbi:MAG TPA: DUF2807 domain-containing protein [Bacteroidales bacterium]|nr:DUF2807 domain-containing protein [Bacteroidales bacterium]MDY0159803.1 DUF2807 domain-containing protein [Bacteroidales bacterium]HRW20860.1 DUF2807 domain-containing protein [Bacteroidales bacterium]
MRKLLILFAILSMAVILNSCWTPFNTIRGVGMLITDTISVGNINGVEVNDVINVVLINSDTSYVVIESQKNILDLVEITVSNGICSVGFKKNVNVMPTLPATVYLFSPIINSIQIDGSGNVSTTNSFDSISNLNIKLYGSGDLQFDWAYADNIFIDIDGSGDMDIFGNGGNVRTTIDGSGDLLIHSNLNSSRFDLNGSGDCTITGSVNNNNLYVDGSGNFYGFGYNTLTTYVRVRGSGNSEIYVSDELNVNILGSGDVIYQGDPLIDFNRTGSGDLINAN